MIGRKRLAIGVTSIAVAGAAFVPALASAGGTPGTTTESSLGATSPPAAFAFTQQAPDGERAGPGHGRGGFGLRGGHGGHGGFGGRGAIGAVLEQFDVTPEEFREAAVTVREQLADARPDVDRPLDDGERVQLQAFATAQRAAIAAELGIDAAAFEQALQDAKAEAQAAHEARHSERQQALADALGVTVEDLRAAFQSLREQFQQRSPGTSLGGA